ncbi:Laminin-like protein epi-1 [Diplonema papillatum]|nr:Laminin-like protein epi-1 [Diplonema papillatum]
MPLRLVSLLLAAAGVAAQSGMCKDWECSENTEEIIYDSTQESCVCICKTSWDGDKCDNCPSAFGGTNCDECAEEMAINYPSCSICRTSTYCSSNADGVEPNAAKDKCVCDCSNGWSGSDCSICPEMYEEDLSDCGSCAKQYTGTFPDCVKCDSETRCYGHAESAVVSGTRCVCTCKDFWSGDDCNTCGASYDATRDCSTCAEGWYLEDEDTCAQCTTETHCNNRATSVSSSNDRKKCTCGCPAQYSGDECENCADGYVELPGNPPVCEACSNELHCNGNAESMSTVNNKCKCKCKAGYDGDACASCAAKYIEDNTSGVKVCIECTVEKYCSSRADSVTANSAHSACVCDCRNKWTGGDCTTCPDRYGGGDCNNCDEEHINYPSCTTVCNSATCNNRADHVEANAARTKCVCDCRDEYEGDTCESCANSYVTDGAGCKKCSLESSCGEHAKSVASNADRTACTCVCETGFDVPRCETCAARYITYPTCTRCTNAEHCNGNSASVTSNADNTACVCNCKNKFDGATCAVCPSNYAGDSCNKCAVGYIKYSTCRECEVGSDCNGHGEEVTSNAANTACSCTCKLGYDGEACNECADGYVNYPTCTKCDLTAVCGDRATDIHSDDDREECVCECKDEYEGRTCQLCAKNYIGDIGVGCTLCTSAAHCYDHAEAVTDDGTRTSCVCDCRNYYDIESGCQTCNSTYGGVDCDTCANPNGVLPTCGTCNPTDHCSGHATSVAKNSSSPTGCTCDCEFSWEGVDCSECPADYNASRDCAVCAGDRVEYPTCRDCTLEHDCTGHAVAVMADPRNERCICKGTYYAWCWGFPDTDCDCDGDQRCICHRDNCPCGEKGCTFWGSCNNMWAGIDCSDCPERYNGTDCDMCAEGRVMYPACFSCDDTNTTRWSQRWDCVANRTEKLKASADQRRCECECADGFEGDPDCGQCAYGHINFPDCTACNLWYDCNGNADTIGSNENRTECVCQCKTGFATSENSQYGQCDSCAEGYIGFPNCELCDIAIHCSGNALEVTDNGKRTKCSCSCYGKYAGDDCSVCPGEFAGDCDECAADRIGYPDCFLCTSDIYCNGHASAVTADAAQQSCICTCENKWGGVHGTCRTCELPYGGTDCNECNEPTHAFPDCGTTCTITDACSNHAYGASMVGAECVCECRHKWEGKTCDECPEKYGGADCNECGAGYFMTSEGECAACTNAGYCNNRACAFQNCVRSNGTDCLCSGCSGKWTGKHCDECPATYGGSTCEACADGYTGYPNCVKCDASYCRDDRAAGVGTRSDGACFCRCKPRFAGELCGECAARWQGANCDECPPGFGGDNCDRCAVGKAGFPVCHTCSVDEHCYGRAESASSDGVHCTCSCYKEWCGGYGGCTVSGPGLEVTDAPPTDAPVREIPTDTPTETLTLTDPTSTPTMTETQYCGLGYGSYVDGPSDRTATPTLTLTLYDEVEEGEDGIWLAAVLMAMLGCCCCVVFGFMWWRRKNKDGRFNPSASNNVMVPLQNVKPADFDYDGDEAPLYDAEPEGLITSVDGPLLGDDASLGSADNSDASLGDAGAADDLDDRADV